MNRSSRIGIDRRLELEWLDAVAARVAAGDGESSIRAHLFEALRGEVRGSRKQGTALHKTVGVLIGAWVLLPEELLSFRDRAIDLLPSLSPSERLAMHWAVLMASYPFLGDVARNTGRLLSLQGSVTLSQLTRRMRHDWGDRSTVDRAAQRIVRSMVQWGTLRDSGERGVYAPASERLTLGSGPAELLLEGLLLHEHGSLPVEQALRHPALFPFDLALRPYDLRRSPLFELHRLGLDVDVIMLREPICDA